MVTIIDRLREKLKQWSNDIKRETDLRKKAKIIEREAYFEEKEKRLTVDATAKGKAKARPKPKGQGTGFLDLLDKVAGDPNNPKDNGAAGDLVDSILGKEDHKNSKPMDLKL